MTLVTALHVAWIQAFRADESIPPAGPLPWPPTMTNRSCPEATYVWSWGCR